VVNHAGADGRLVRALLAADAPEGWVVAGTGNGSVHRDLAAALQEAQAAGAQVLRTSRCAFGVAQAHPGDMFPVAEGLAPAKARIALWLSLLQAQQR
jgi:L-asparaginase